jgi:hypothetical protein
MRVVFRYFQVPFLLFILAFGASYARPMSTFAEPTAGYVSQNDWQRFVFDDNSLVPALCMKSTTDPSEQIRCLERAFVFSTIKIKKETDFGTNVDFQLCVPLSTNNDLSVRVEAARIRFVAPLSLGPVRGTFTPDILIGQHTTAISGTLSGNLLNLEAIFNPSGGWSEERWLLRLPQSGSDYLGNLSTERTRLEDGLVVRYESKAWLREAPPVARDVNCNDRERRSGGANGPLP